MVHIDGINGSMSLTKLSFQYIGHGLTCRGCVQPGLLVRGNWPVIQPRRDPKTTPGHRIHDDDGDDCQLLVIFFIIFISPYLSYFFKLVFIYVAFYNSLINQFK